MQLLDQIFEIIFFYVSKMPKIRKYYGKVKKKYQFSKLSFLRGKNGLNKNA